MTHINAVNSSRFGKLNVKIKLKKHINSSRLMMTVDTFIFLYKDVIILIKLC